MDKISGNPIGGVTFSGGVVNVFAYDSLSEAGRVLGTAGNSSGGERELTAVFAEWRLPFTPSFDLTLAAFLAMVFSLPVSYNHCSGAEPTPSHI